jgi:gluconate kinase
MEGSKELILSRLESRCGHFMPPGLFDCQFAILGEPTEAEAVIIPMIPRWGKS